MTMAQKINMAMAYKGMSQAALARAISMTPSNFNQKLKRETFSTEELDKIAEALVACTNFALYSQTAPKYKALLLLVSNPLSIDSHCQQTAAGEYNA